VAANARMLAANQCWTVFYFWSFRPHGRLKSVDLSPVFFYKGISYIQQHTYFLDERHG
jgi:hypothetical protein